MLVFLGSPCHTNSSLAAARASCGLTESETSVQSWVWTNEQKKRIKRKQLSKSKTFLLTICLESFDTLHRFLPSADCCSHSGYVTQTSVWFITSCTCLLLRFNVQTWLKCNAFLPECRHISKSLAGTLMDSAGSLSLNLFIYFWYSTSGTFRPCLMLLDRSNWTWLSWKWFVLPNHI